MGDIGDKNAQTAAALWAVWDAQRTLASGADPDRLSPPAQKAYARLLELSPAMCDCRGTLPGHIRAPRHYNPGQDPEPKSWLAEYQAVMAEPLALPDGTLDRLAPYAPDPAPGLNRLIKAAAPARRHPSVHPAALYVLCAGAIILAVSAFVFALWPLAIGTVICLLLAGKTL